ncbi:GNAT family N-acetyltransferase [bacterium]|nr:GNAT family N-acetyltransferase [bacterium]
MNDPEEIRYEELTAAPTEEIVALYRAGGWWTESDAARAAIPKMIRGSFCFLGARRPDGRLVGMARAISDGASDAYIQDVVVLPDWRGRGIGGEMIRRLVARCRAAGIEWIGLVAEPGTIPFYERLGFAALEGFTPLRHGLKARP